MIPPPTHQRHGRYEAYASDCHGPFNPGTRPKTRLVLAPARLIGTPTVRIFFVVVGNNSVPAKGSPSGQRLHTRHHHGVRKGSARSKKSPPHPRGFCPTVYMPSCIFICLYALLLIVFQTKKKHEHIFQRGSFEYCSKWLTFGQESHVLIM